LRQLFQLFVQRRAIQLGGDLRVINKCPKQNWQITTLQEGRDNRWKTAGCRRDFCAMRSP
jgi:hypothetical protein